MPFSRKIFALFVAGALTAGCVNLDPVADGTRFYTLTGSSAESPAPREDAVRVGLRVVAVSDYLRRPAIAVRSRSHEITYSDENRWADRLDHAMTQVLIEALQVELPETMVVSSQGVRIPGSDVLVEANLSSCEGTSDGRALLGLEWRIIGPRDGEGIRIGRFSASRSGWNQGDFEQLAGLLSALAGDAAGRMAADVRSLLESSTAGAGT